MAMTEVLNALKSMIVSDVMEDVKNALAVLARDKAGAMKVFETQWEKIKVIFSENAARACIMRSKTLRIARGHSPRHKLSEAKIVSLFGKFSSAESIFHVRTSWERLAKRDIIAKRAHVLEWLTYCDYNVKKGIYEADFNVRENVEFRLKLALQGAMKRR